MLYCVALDENRTSSLLLGVVVRTGTRRKRTGDQAANDGTVPFKAAKLAKSAKSTPPSTSNNSSPSLNYIPTSRSNSKKAAKNDQAVRRSSVVEPESTTAKNQVDDAPYSPGQLLDEEPIPGKST